MMKITVLGLWHLGSVTAACCAQHFEVTGLDFDAAALEGLRQGKAQVMEPGLDALLADGLNAGRLRFSSDAEAACANADILWVCYDTPVDDNDTADVDFVLERIRRCARHLPKSAIMIISSQVPVGTCQLLEAEFPGVAIAIAPENLRLGKALDVFRNPDRIIIGVREDTVRTKLEPLFSTWSSNLIWMRPESAEMTKHGINTFLAMSIAFMNEIARICEQTGADAKEVECGLKSEKRIGPGACLRAGSAFAGGTLARDVVMLTRIAEKRGDPLVLIPSIKASNDRHKLWALGKLKHELGSLQGTVIAVLGLSYKPGTDTLRRSLAVELCHALEEAGAQVQAFDPGIKSRPAEIDKAWWKADLPGALAHADAAVICTEWPEFKKTDWTKVIGFMKLPLLLDANGFITPPEGARYFRVGSTGDC